MPYVALADLNGKIPPQFIVQALDDDADGEVDAGIWDLIAEQVGDAIDSALGQRYAVPFAEPFPAVVKHAAIIFAAEAVYSRRVAPDQNPWTKMADEQRKKLTAIGNGDQPLAPSIERQQPSGTLISEAAKTTSSTGRFM